jgi:hypothetical protein
VLSHPNCTQSPTSTCFPEPAQYSLQVARGFVAFGCCPVPEASCSSLAFHCTIRVRNCTQNRLSRSCPCRVTAKSKNPSPSFSLLSEGSALSSRNLWAALREERFVKSVLAYQREHPHPEFFPSIVDIELHPDAARKSVRFNAT